MTSPTLQEALDALLPSYRGIDLRSLLVAFGDKDVWHGLFTIIRLSGNTPDMIAAEHTALLKECGIPADFRWASWRRSASLGAFRGFKVELAAYAPDQLKHIISRVGYGMVSSGERAFQAWKGDGKFDVLEQQVILRQDAYATDNGPWAVFFWGHRQQTTEPSLPDSSDVNLRITERQLSDWSRDQGFGDFRDACESLLRSPWGQGNVLEIRAPIYARIKELEHIPTGIRATGLFHRSLGPLTLEGSTSMWGSQGYEVRPPRRLGRAEITSRTRRKELVPFIKTFPIGKPPESGRAEVTLFKRTPRRVDLGGKSTLLRSGVPIFQAFVCFIPETDVGEYLDLLSNGASTVGSNLYKKFKAKDSSKKDSELLEYVTMYLLALVGFTPILLSNPQYDALPEGAGSADIIAATPENEPLLVSCTMAMPDARKRGLLASARYAITRKFGWRREWVRTLLITGKPDLSEPSSDQAEMAASDLLSLWGYLQQGNVASARALIAPNKPRPSPDRRP